MEKLYKGEIGRLEFLKYFIACGFINWILSFVATIVATVFNPYLAILNVIVSLPVWILILFNYKKRGMGIFKNEILSWLIAIFVTFTSFVCGIWQLAYAISSNLYTAGKITELPFYATDINALVISKVFGGIGLIITIIFLIYLFVPSKKND